MSIKLIKNLFNQKNILSEILSIFITSRLLIVSAGYLSSLIIIKDKWFSKPGSVLDIFFRWDSGWYMNIVKNGYSYIPGKYSNIAFFPLYPMIVKVFSSLFGNPKLIGFIVSNIALLIAVIYLYKLIKLDLNDSIASKTVFYMLIFPLSFFFSIFYTEGLFLLLVISSFYYARKKKWLLASILGFFLSLTRSVGVLIFIPLVVEYLGISFKTFKINLGVIKKDILYLLLIPAGLVTYMLYLHFKFKDALAFLHIQSVWGRNFTSFLKTMTNIDHYSFFYRLIFLSSVIFASMLILYLIYSRIRASYLVYTFLFLLLYLSTGLLEAIPRFISVLFPLYLGMSLLANKSKFLDYSLTLFSVMLLTLFTVLFVNGYWFI